METEYNQLTEVEVDLKDDKIRIYFDSQEATENYQNSC